MIQPDNSATTFTLDNGLRVVCADIPSDVIYCGYVVCAGTRHEAPSDSGLAHFVEHMTFKGTENRKSYQITNGLERVGGDLNAYTTKQETVYHAAILREHFSRAADLLTDIVFRSIYPQKEVVREVEVVCDEIDSYHDSPSDEIFDEFERIVFSNHPLGRDILGDSSRLRTYTSQDVLRFAHQYYRPTNCVFFTFGRIGPQRVRYYLEKFTRDIHRGETSSVPASAFCDQTLTPYEPKQISLDKNTHQAHVIVGGRSFAGTDERKYAMILLNNILGGPGMNSRLNISLREKAGLVYSVDSYLSTYPDAGMWTIYFGCNETDIKRCLHRVSAELDKLIQSPLTPRQLEAAKRQLCGQIGVANNSFESRALALGRTFAHYNVIRDTAETCNKIRALTADELLGAARETFGASQRSVLIYK
ncbi:MAG: insulinase family protein [Alloprevotella sp.]|nr:insulinase family protein [Alloprevotella sp.]